MNKIITIGREFGSGGRELGKILAEKLGYAFYDKEIITETAKRTSLSEDYVKQILENNPYEVFHVSVAHSFASTQAYNVHQKHNVFAMQKKVIKEMAEKSNCVIVGRCSDYLLKDYNPYKIFVYADMESKLVRCKNRLKTPNEFSDRQIKRNIKRIDRNRAKYYNFYTGQKWGNRLNYDICVNTTGLDFDKLATHLADMLK